MACSTWSNKKRQNKKTHLYLFLQKNHRKDISEIIKSYTFNGSRKKGSKYRGKSDVSLIVPFVWLRLLEADFFIPK